LVLNVSKQIKKKRKWSKVLFISGGDL
jgi:hypothetical protein